MKTVNAAMMMHYLSPSTLVAIVKDAQEQLIDNLADAASKTELTTIQMRAFSALVNNVGSEEAIQMTAPCAATAVYVEPGDFVEYEDDEYPTGKTMAMVLKVIWQEENRVALKLAHDAEDEEGTWVYFEFGEYNIL